MFVMNVRNSDILQENIDIERYPKNKEMNMSKKITDHNDWGK